MSNDTTDDIINACRNLPTDALASALYNTNDPHLLGILAEALETASHHLAYYPHHEVVLEADALLIEVLRWPIADALHDGQQQMTAPRLAELLHRDVGEAQRIIDHLAATESDAAKRLISSGVEPNFTGAQAQVTHAIEAVLADGRVPTRASVREYATHVARRAMRPWRDGEDPIITHPTLPQRIMSPSPITTVFAWLDRMETTPVGPDYINERITYLAEARRAAGSAARTEQRAALVRERAASLDATPAVDPLTSHVSATTWGVFATRSTASGPIEHARGHARSADASQWRAVAANHASSMEVSR